VRRLRNTVQPYAWGSRTAIAGLQGRPAPTADPEAELWLGAHPGAPSLLGDEDPPRPLPDLIAADPEVALGPAVLGRFGARLPYLLKILAAEAPLSLQAHPDEKRAAAGYAAEGSPPRNYVDPYHKPELLVAVEPFEALCGFRDPDASADALAGLDVADLAPVVAALRTGPVPARLREAVRLLMEWPAADRAGLVAAVAAPGPGGPARALAVRLGALHPGDIGVVVALLLNQVRLRRDEAVFMPAGNLHSYLRGTGVEIMAASDNVLRGGLTPKRVDVPELLRVLRYEVLDEPVLRPEPVGPGLLTWPTPVAEFRLVKAAVGAGVSTLPGTGPRIVVCLGGTALLGPDRISLGPGESVFVPAIRPEVWVSGPAVVFQAAVPDPT
jgi:mannose-6-phosphate isomerase